MTPTIVSRAEAKAAGLKHYYTGKACKRGHTAQRRTDDRICRQCNTRTGYQREYKLKRKYGITSADFDAMLARQKYQCRSCGDHEHGNKQNGWVVDHCHGTGRVRGIVCHGCNTGIGAAKESIEKLQAMIEYLRHSMQ